jgi:hypothetical protein
MTVYPVSPVTTVIESTIVKALTTPCTTHSTAQYDTAQAEQTPHLQSSLKKSFPVTKTPIEYSSHTTPVYYSNGAEYPSNTPAPSETASQSKHVNHHSHGIPSWYTIAPPSPPSSSYAEDYENDYSSSTSVVYESSPATLAYDTPAYPTPNSDVSLLVAGDEYSTTPFEAQRTTLPYQGEPEASQSSSSYPNATRTYEGGNSGAATTTSPAAYTGGAMTYGVQGGFGGALVVAAVFLGFDVL